MKIISVVMPVYNVEEYLDACVHSVIHQTYQNIEIILVDDGSTDSSPQMCDSYAKKDSRIKVIHQPNAGLSMARNAGMACATGSYIYFLDSDDYIAPNTIKILYEAIEKEKSDLVFFDAHTVYDGKESGFPAMEYMRKKAYESCQGSEMLLKLHLDGVFYTAVPLMLMDFAYIRKIGLTFYPGILHEDNLFTVIAYLKARKVTHVHNALYYRRMRENSIMTVPFSKRNFLGYSTCIQKLIPYYQEAQEGSYAKRFLARFLKERMNWTVNGYFDLKISEQSAVTKDFSSLRKVLTSVKFFGNWHAWFKCYFRWVNRVYHTYSSLR